METTLFASSSMDFVKAAVALPQPRDIPTTPKRNRSNFCYRDNNKGFHTPQKALPDTPSGFSNKQKRQKSYSVDRGNSNSGERSRYDFFTPKRTHIPRKRSQSNPINNSAGGYVQAQREWNYTIKTSFFFQTRYKKTTLIQKDSPEVASRESKVILPPTTEEEGHVMDDTNKIGSNIPGIAGTTTTKTLHKLPTRGPINVITAPPKWENGNSDLKVGGSLRFFKDRWGETSRWQKSFVSPGLRWKGFSPWTNPAERKG